MMGIPNWWMKGDWFDVCSCNIPCPWGFAQAPTNNRCEGVMAYHVREGAYGDVDESEHVFMCGHKFGQAFDVVFGAGGDEAGAKYLMRRVLHFANGAPAVYQYGGSAFHFMLGHLQ